MPTKVEGLNNFTVDREGAVVNTKTGKTIAHRVVRGYHYVDLWEGANRKNLRLGRLVAKHFIPNPLCKPEVNHIDGNRFNDTSENLEWVTRSENEIHKIKLQKENGTYVTPKGNMKYSRDVIDRVFELRGENKLHREIALETGMAQSTVNHILLGSRRSLQ